MPPDGLGRACGVPFAGGASGLPPGVSGPPRAPGAAAPLSSMSPQTRPHVTHSGQRDNVHGNLFERDSQRRGVGRKTRSRPPEGPASHPHRRGRSRGRGGEAGLPLPSSGAGFSGRTAPRRGPDTPLAGAPSLRVDQCRSHPRLPSPARRPPTHSPPTRPPAGPHVRCPSSCPGAFERADPHASPRAGLR